MIESRFWKRDLLKFAKYLKELKEIKRWTEGTQVLFEKKVIINFFIIRKLIETNKISDSLQKKKYKLSVFPKSGQKLTTINYMWIHEQYNLNKTEIKSKGVKFICNQLIHSLTIFAQTENDIWDRVIMTSDFKKNDWLYVLEVETIIEIMNDFGNNYPREIRHVLNKAGDDYDVFIN